ncbi:hypothetical protein [Natronococcus pandeyae]|nr:hypothetical protein [Natronococcus pandeyae]
MCHHFESVAELSEDERADVLESHSDEELEDKLTEDELEALTA